MEFVLHHVLGPLSARTPQPHVDQLVSQVTHTITCVKLSVLQEPMARILSVSALAKFQATSPQI